MIVREELWIKTPGLTTYVVTTNASVKTNGELVMGRGAAAQAVARLPRIAKQCGDHIDHGMTYGFLMIHAPSYSHPGFGIFQVKKYWMDDADLGLIAIATSDLLQYAKANPLVNIRMNYPGIGNGKLSRANVEPLLTDLADYVTICYR